MATARGSFDVSMTPCETPRAEGGAELARMVLDKAYHGNLDATGRGQMLACTTNVEGSAGYVALEVVEGSLAGRTGAFVLQHFGIMDRGEPALRIAVVPDSGTGDLAGLRGELAIDIVDGSHRYELTYDFSE